MLAVDLNLNCDSRGACPQFPHFSFAVYASSRVMHSGHCALCFERWRAALSAPHRYELGIWILRLLKNPNKTQTLLSQNATAWRIFPMSYISNVRQSFKTSRHVGPVRNPRKEAHKWHSANQVQPVCFYVALCYLFSQDLKFIYVLIIELVLFSWDNEIMFPRFPESLISYLNKYIFSW